MPKAEIMSADSGHGMGEDAADKMHLPKRRKPVGMKKMMRRGLVSEKAAAKAREKADRG